MSENQNLNNPNTDEVVDNQNFDTEAVGAGETVSDCLSSEDLSDETASADEQSKQDTPQPENTEEILKKQVAELQDKYIRLAAEYDNYRRRTAKERLDLLRSAGEDILMNILPVVDNFERAMAAASTSTDVDAVKLGIELIYNKFTEFLKQKGVTEIESVGKDFNVDLHEAITKIPAPVPDLKGKVVDVVEKGYYLNEKIIRYAKVVVGE